MTIYRSQGLVDYIITKGSVRNGLNNCRILLFAGTQPTDANTGSGGVSALVSLTPSSGSYVAETLPSWSFQVTGSSGSVSSIKIGGIEQLVASVPYNSSVTQTCADIVNAINNNGAAIDFTASVTGVGSDYVTIYGPITSGATLNSLTLAVTSTLSYVLTNSGNTVTTGTNAVNGGLWKYPPATGVISKEDTVWSGTVATGGTATWFMIATDSDLGTTVSTTARRVIGSVGTAGTDLILSNSVLTVGASVTINSWTLTVSK